MARRSGESLNFCTLDLACAAVGRVWNSRRPAVPVIVGPPQIHPAGYAAIFIIHGQAQHTPAGELLDSSPAVFHHP